MHMHTNASSKKTPWKPMTQWCLHAVSAVTSAVTCAVCFFVAARTLKTHFIAHISPFVLRAM